jgi:hypothetical protein
MKARESDLADERKNRLQADREKEVAKQMILKLQQENWGLRKARSVRFFIIHFSIIIRNGVCFNLISFVEGFDLA